MNQVTPLAVIIAIAAVVTIAATNFAPLANAKANVGKANPVAPGANSNGPYQTSCKESSTAKECATGPNNNGEFTSNTAHGVNGP